MRRTRASDERFTGRIAGFGTAAGPRFVIGMWHESPFGRFADVMVEHADARRQLFAPTEAVADYVSSTYTFDEVHVAAVRFGRVAGGLRVMVSDADEARDDAAPDVRGVGAARGSAHAGGATAEPGRGVGAARGSAHADNASASPSILDARLLIGPITPLGRLLRAVPAPLALSPAWLRAVDPVAALLVPGAHTSGSAGGGRREYYGVRTIRALTGVSVTWNGRDLGAVAPLHPPVTFGFGSAPAVPSLVDLTTIIHTVKALA